MSGTGTSLELEVVTQGLRYPEGPVALADGSVLVTEIRASALTRVLPDGTREIVAELGGAPNGAAIGPDGAVYVCNNGGSLIMPEDFDAPGAAVVHAPAWVTGSIQRVDLATGAHTTVYHDYDGGPLNAPNDLVFDATGGFWFTCFGHSDGESRRMGAIFYARADGSHLARWRHDQVSPNGIGLSPDQRTLYWADSMTQKLWAAEIVAPGEIGPPSGPAAARPVVTLPGLRWPDSLAVEASGRVCVATLFDGAITVIDPADGAHETIPIPDMLPTNIAFGGADMRDAWITGSASGTLYRCRWPRPGLTLAFPA